jgi:CheY-like chemotaxis protein
MQRMGAILVFDNAAIIAELMATLGGEGYTIRNTLDSTLAPAISIAPPPALIVLDLALPTQTVAAVHDYARSYDPFHLPSRLVSRGF